MKGICDREIQLWHKTLPLRVCTPSPRIISPYGYTSGNWMLISLKEMEIGPWIASAARFGVVSLPLLQKLPGELKCDPFILCILCFRQIQRKNVLCNNTIEDRRLQVREQSASHTVQGSMNGSRRWPLLQALLEMLPMYVTKHTQSPSSWSTFIYI